MMRKYFALVLIVLLPLALWSQTPDPGRTPRWDKALDYIKNGQYTMTYKTLTSPTITSPTITGNGTTTGTLDMTVSNTAAGGDKGVNVSLTQSTNALTGNLIAGAFVATNSSVAAANGVIYGLEVKSRAATSGNVGNTIGRLDGVYASVDAKNKTATTMRAFEASLDGAAGGSSTEAVAFEAFNNSSATQTASYAFSANGGTASGHKAYTADLRLQNGETISNDADGIIKMNGAVNFAAAGGTYAASVGILGGAGSSGLSSAYSLGNTAGNNKGLSFYLKSTSTTASDVVEGLYVTTYHGTVATSAAPSGEAGRFRAYLTGDASGSVALVGMHSTVEAASGSSSSGMTLGGRMNLVLPSEQANFGKCAGAQAEIYTLGNGTDLSTSNASLMQLSLSGTAPSNAAQLTIPVFDIDVFSNLVGDGLILDDSASDATVGAKLRIKVNGTTYWVMLADSHN